MAKFSYGRVKEQVYDSHRNIYPSQFKDQML